MAIGQQESGADAGYQRDLFEDKEPQWIEVDYKRIAVDRTRKFGGAWLGLELVRRLGLDEFVNRTVKLAHGLRAALDKTKSVK